MMRITTLAAGVLLAACQTAQSTDPSSLAYRLPAGSVLSLNKPVEIPHDKTHVNFQYGKVVSDRDRKNYQVNCRLEMKSFGPRTIEPEVFKIRRIESDSDVVSDAGIYRNYTDVFLASDKGTDVIKLECQQYGDKTVKPFTADDAQKALGDIITAKTPTGSL